MIKPINKTLLTGLILLSACSPAPSYVNEEDKLDMVSVKQFVSDIKSSKDKQVVPLPKLKLGKPLAPLAKEPFRFNPPVVIEDWHKHGGELKAKGRTSG